MKKKLCKKVSFRAKSLPVSIFLATFAPGYEQETTRKVGRPVIGCCQVYYYGRPVSHMVWRCIQLEPNILSGSNGCGDYDSLCGHLSLWSLRSSCRRKEKKEKEKVNMTPADAMLYLVIAASIAILVYVKIGKRDSRGQVRWVITSPSSPVASATGLFCLQLLLLWKKGHRKMTAL